VVVTILEVCAGDTHGGARSAVPSLKKNGEGFAKKKNKKKKNGKERRTQGLEVVD
jgi:hypothetical protein